MIGNQHTAQRIVNAEADFIDTVRGIAGCSQQEAAKVLRVYRKLKVAKLDAVIGRVYVAHGMYMEADVIRNAIDFNEWINTMDNTAAFFVMVDWDQTADSAETIGEARDKARRVFNTDPLRVNVSIHDSDGELIEDLGLSRGRGGLAIRQRRTP